MKIPHIVDRLTDTGHIFYHDLELKVIFVHGRKKNKEKIFANNCIVYIDMQGCLFARTIGGMRHIAETNERNIELYFQDLFREVEQ